MTEERMVEIANYFGFSISKKNKKEIEFEFRDIKYSVTIEKDINLEDFLESLRNALQNIGVIILRNTILKEFKMRVV